VESSRTEKLFQEQLMEEEIYNVGCCWSEPGRKPLKNIVREALTWNPKDRKAVPGTVN